MFGDEALRLLRESWPSVNMLAEELYAIFRAVDAQPTELQGPVTILNNGSEPALTTQGLDGSNGDIRLRSPDGTSITIEDGGIRFGDIIFPPGGIPTSGGGGSSGSGAIPGQVQSGGPGQGPYVVTSYPKGLLLASESVSVTQLGIASDAKVPAGTWALITKTDSGYYMQVPVWGPPAT